MARKKKNTSVEEQLTQEELAQKKLEKRSRRRKGWIIALSIIGVIVISIISIISYHSYSPHTNFYGNGKVWATTDNFDDQYQDMLSFTFDDNRPLKVMQIADPQLKFGSWTQDIKTMALLDKAIDQLKPDIAVVTGDLTYSLFAGVAVKHFADFMESKQLYWTFTYGNHDSEIAFSKFRHSELLSGYKYCLFDGGPSNIEGESNYFVNIKDGSGNLLYALCMMDSNMYQEGQTDLFSREYGDISQEQVDWYKWNIQGLQSKNPNIQSSMFMHIPFKKFLDVHASGNYAGSILELDREFNGEKIAGIAFQGGEYGENIYKAIVELNSTKGVFVGHDHVNTMRGATTDGVLLAYGRGCGYHTYPFFQTPGESALLEGIVAKFWGFSGASMYLDEWKDNDGNYLGKGVSIIEIDVNTSSATYGDIYMYDVSHLDLDNNRTAKQFEYSLDA